MSKLLSPSAGMVSGSALLIDYVLTITISVASGADALFSFLPASFLPYKITFAVVGVLFLTVMNMRGVKESVLLLLPVFLLFVVTHAVMIGYAFVMNAGDLGDLVAATRADVAGTQAELGLAGMIRPDERKGMCCHRRNAAPTLLSPLRPPFTLRANG